MTTGVEATPFDKLLVFSEVWPDNFDTLDVSQILTITTVSPVISETYAFYSLFYGEDGIVRRNETMEIDNIQPVGSEAAPADTSSN